jgi:hypothetical protein
MALRRAHRSLRHARWGDLHGLEWCPRWILTERLPEVVAPWARRTRRLVAWPRPSRQSLPVVAAPHYPRLTARQAAWLV